MYIFIIWSICKITIIIIIDVVVVVVVVGKQPKMRTMYEYLHMNKFENIVQGVRTTRTHTKQVPSKRQIEQTKTVTAAAVDFNSTTLIMANNPPQNAFTFFPAMIFRRFRLCATNWMVFRLFTSCKSLDVSAKHESFSGKIHLEKR